MLGDIDDLIRSNQGERTIISNTIGTLVDSALDVADLSMKEGDLSSSQKKAIEGLEAGLVKLIKSDIILEHNVTELMKIREKIKRSARDDEDQDEMDEEDDIAFEPAPEPTLDDIKKHEKYREFYKKVWKKDLDKENGDDESDDDDDLAVVSNQVSLTCPITKKIYEHPVKNKNCGHTYSRDAILEYIRTNTGKDSTPCPVAGCSADVTRSSLEDDEDMEFELKRAERRKEIHFSQADGEQNTQSYVDL